MKRNKRIRKPRKRIFPCVAICKVCKKNKVTDHHIACNSCCSKRDKELYRAKQRKLLPKIF